MCIAGDSTPIRWRGIVAYDGTEFNGWQWQPVQPSVQRCLEESLARVLGAEVRIHGSGRTDAGAHARGQVFHFDAPWAHGADKLLAAWRNYLPASVLVRRLSPASPQFHARFTALGKRYSYHVVPGFADPFRYPYAVSFPWEVDSSKAQDAMNVLRGRHNFRAFCALARPLPKSYVRTLWRFECRWGKAEWRFIAEADGFLYKMVRSLVGTVLAVGTGKLSLDELRDGLESGQRVPAIQSMPAKGLFLEKVFYRPSELPAEAVALGSQNAVDDE